MGWQLHVNTCYNALYAGYAWPVVKAAYGVGWPVYGSLLLLLFSTRSGHAQLSYPGFLLLLLLLCPQKTLVQVSVCLFALVAKSCQRASTHPLTFSRVLPDQSRAAHC